MNAEDAENAEKKFSPRARRDRHPRTRCLTPGDLFLRSSSVNSVAPCGAVGSVFLRYGSEVAPPGIMMEQPARPDIERPVDPIDKPPPDIKPVPPPDIPPPQGQPDMYPPTVPERGETPMA